MHVGHPRAGCDPGLPVGGDFRLCLPTSASTNIMTMFFDDDLPVLSRAECEGLLASTHVGRVSLTVGALPVVVPVNYQYLGGDIIIGMRDGPVRRAFARPNVIGLGVDNATSTDADWAVLAIGRASEVTDPDERAQFHALGLAASTETTPPHFVRLRPDHLSGYHTQAPTEEAVQEVATVRTTYRRSAGHPERGPQ